jgi:hypothetical protein
VLASKEFFSRKRANKLLEINDLPWMSCHEYMMFRLIYQRRFALGRFTPQKKYHSFLLFGNLLNDGIGESLPTFARM